MKKGQYSGNVHWWDRGTAPSYAGARGGIYSLENPLHLPEAGVPSLCELFLSLIRADAMART
jgi:hypothetical protein